MLNFSPRYNVSGFQYIFVSTINILQFLWQVLIFLFLVVPLISLVWKIENEAELGKALLVWEGIFYGPPQR